MNMAKKDKEYGTNKEAKKYRIGDRSGNTTFKPLFYVVNDLHCSRTDGRIRRRC